MDFSNPKFLRSVWQEKEIPPETSVIVFAGRSNAGKSSTINALCNGRFARVSRDPGRTRMINLFQLANGAILADLPGYGYAKISRKERKSWAPRLNKFLRAEQIFGMVVIMDCRRGLGELDSLLLSAFNIQSLLIIMSKSDKLNRSQLNLAKRTLEKKLNEMEINAVVVPFSALKKTGINEARTIIQTWIEGT